MELYELDDATKAASEAEALDPKSLQTHFVLYNIYLRTGNKDKCKYIVTIKLFIVCFV